MTPNEIIQVLERSEGQRIRLQDGYGRTFKAVPAITQEEGYKNGYRVVTVLLDVESSGDIPRNSNPVVVAVRPPESKWVVNVHYFSSEMPETQLMEWVEPVEH